MNPVIHRHTPVITARDPRGLSVRTLTYQRALVGAPAERRITLRRYDLVGRLIQQWDPRLLANEEAANEVNTLSLSGIALATNNVDAGLRVNLYALTGLRLETWDSRSSHTRWVFDALPRPVTLHESIDGADSRITQRFAYGPASQESAAHNQCGRLIRQDDSAGTLKIIDYGLSSERIREVRHFLHMATLAQWPESVLERDQLLEAGEGAQTIWRYGPMQNLLLHVDARGNRQRSRLTLAGQLNGMSLQLFSGLEQHVLMDLQYDATGQATRQRLGNGTLISAHHDDIDGRLLQLSAMTTRRKTVQDLRYTYDPVGNVRRVEDRSQSTRYFANRRSDPVTLYEYDSLGQLIRTTGREAIGATISPQLPPLAPVTGDTHLLTPYTQTYRYDTAGNLIELRHVGRQQYTRTLIVDPRSNRGAPPDLVDFDNGFDANGNLLQLQRGQYLSWDGRNQLSATLQVVRENADDDREDYRYDGGGQRVRKLSVSKTKNTLRHREVRYCSGLEIRTDGQERLDVCTMDFGLGSVRCLHWHSGQPAGIDNDQVRYAINDPLGSSCLELDADARIISQEGYYPYGGTAWWAAQSDVQASYKIIRYSGKERDASGLYYYGFRYYAPWLQRWLNPDPAGTSDGLNLYRFVDNSPLRYADTDGLQKIEIIDYHSRKNVPATEVVHKYYNYSHYGSRNAIGMEPAINEAFQFAYDVAWTTKSWLHHGAGNQIGDILTSDYQSHFNVKRLRREVKPNPTTRNYVEHAIAAGTGNCGEFADVSSYLAASSSHWPNLPIYNVVPKDVDHQFVLLGDSREMDPIVLDPWTMHPIPHRLSDNEFRKSELTTSDSTPRFPEDPVFMIDDQIEALKSALYEGSPNQSEKDQILAAMVSQVQGLTSNGMFWTTPSFMLRPSNVISVSSNFEAVSLAAIPQAFRKKLEGSLSETKNFIQKHARPH